MKTLLLFVISAQIVLFVLMLKIRNRQFDRTLTESFDSLFTGGLKDDSAALHDAPMDVTFIDQSTGRTSVFQVQSIGANQYVQSPLETFTKDFKEKEAIARSSRLVTADNYAKTLPRLYSRFLLDFAKEEKDAISAIIGGNQQLRTFSWHFMKMDDTMEFGRPFIFGNTIVLSASACKKFASPQSDQDKSDNKTLLMRYQIYLEQLADPDKFEALYKSLKPQDALVKNTPADPIWTKVSHLQVPTEITEVMYHDPNTRHRYWIFESAGERYWPGLFIDKDFKLVQLAFKTKTDGEGLVTILGESVELAKFAQQPFGGSDIFYHPACQVGGNPMALKMDMLMKFSQ